MESAAKAGALLRVHKHGPPGAGLNRPPAVWHVLRGWQRAPEALGLHRGFLDTGLRGLGVPLIGAQEVLLDAKTVLVEEG